ncbi:aminotransferase class V-fold PLP-dependent enzyme [uncultured Cetobacterium sp.]|uniref:aminotransferase class V-fold PLP-dependent enzyme n=1 Tax=uncultured Cetobacterium sp. TaxID=527638 RepID=UPI0026054F84|nr:aminotransferase class V-fold PLP-dependent enzyme [uncultured Cetobacterium sp.]
MKNYYFDNSATSSPKPDSVYDVVDYSIRELNGNPGRAGYRKSLEISREIFKVREIIADFFNVEDSLNIAFTANATESLNFAIKGTIKENSHVITTNFEHNSVLRPLFSLRDEKNVELTFVNTWEEIEKEIKENTKAIVVNHISNVNGTIQNIKEIGKICKKKNILFIVDASQSGGYTKIDMQENSIDILCITGHKSLFGIQGIGAICLNTSNTIYKIKPLLEGGTGSFSKYERQPLEMPELLESGTLNTPGIISLGAGIEYIKSQGIENIEKHENLLIEKFIIEIEKLERVKVYKSITKKQGPVVSLNIENVDSGELASILDEEFGIMVRPGFHCAPRAHKAIGTYETGTVRFSFGYFNSEDDIDYIVESFKKILDEI